MRVIAGFCLAVFCALASAGACADQGAYPKTDGELQAAYNALQWRTKAGPYNLPASHATVQLPPGRALLLGADAERYSWLGSGIEFPRTEAVLTYDSDSAPSEVYYEWRDEGYVSDSDWEDVDGDELLAQYRDSTEASNDERVKNGFLPMHVVGWLEPPRYDKATRTVTYAMELKDDESGWVNAVALRLGRAGYTEFTWVGSIDLFRNAAGRPELLDQALATHSFDDGHRYEDFKDGDKVAAYGIAGLVATALGVKFGKGLIAAAIAFLVAGKKIIIPVVAVAGVALFRFGRRLFRRGES